MCLSKKQGGLGFRDLECFNQAQFTNKYGGYFTFRKLSLQVYKSWCYTDTGFMSAKIGTNSSYAWKSIMLGRELLSLGLTRLVGSGETFQVWMDSGFWYKIVSASQEASFFINP